MLIRQKNDTPEDHQVRLRPFLGIHPAQYTKIGLLLLVIGLVFSVLVLPGMIKPGVQVFLDSIPSKARVHVNGALLGVTPCNFFLENDDYTLEISHPFFQSQTVVQKTRGNRIGSLFFKKKEKIIVTFCELKLEPALSELKESITQLGMYSSFATATSFPPVFQDLVSLLDVEQQLNTIELIDELLDNALLFIDNQLELKALFSARAQFFSQRKLFSQNAAIKLLGKFITLKEKYERFPLWLKNTTHFPGEESNWFAAYSKSYFAQFLKKENQESIKAESEKSFQYQDIVFCRIPGTTTLWGEPEILTPLPRYIQLTPFSISQGEITNAQFYRFIQANPAWDKSNSAELISQGKITAEYLRHWPGSEPETAFLNHPVIHISWYAAQAYAQWMSRELEITKPGFSARLLWEKEFQYLAQAGTEVIGDNEFYGLNPSGHCSKNDFGVLDLIGNVNEWCDDWYYPCADIFFRVDSTEQSSGIPGTEKVVRGGSWINDLEEIGDTARGAQPPSWCTPYTGFHIVIEEGTEDVKKR